MKYFERTLAIIALLTLTVQTTRHLYILWWQPKGSVLDRFDQPVMDQISKAGSLDDLVRAYEPLRKQADGDRAKRGEAAAVRNLPPGYAFGESRPEELLRAAIEDWEAKAKEIHALRFYAGIGIVLTLIGAALYLRWNRWFGLTVVVTGLSEIAYWTGVTFLGPSKEWIPLLIHKFWFSLTGLLLLLVVIWLFGVFKEDPARRTTA